MIVRHRAGTPGRFGVEGAAEPDLAVKGVIIVPIGSSEQDDREETVVERLTAFCPPGTDIVASDEVTARGHRFEVAGAPADYRSAKGKAKVLAVTLQRAT